MTDLTLLERPPTRSRSHRGAWIASIGLVALLATAVGVTVALTPHHHSTDPISAGGAPAAATGTREFPALNATLTDIGPAPRTALPPASILARVPAAYLHRYSVSPTVQYGVFTDHGEAAWVAHGGKAYGLVARRVWVVAFDHIPLAEAPRPDMGPLPGQPPLPPAAQARRAAALAQAQKTGYLTLLIYDARTGQQLEEVDAPEPG